MSEWIFITGGCGYIGSHIAAHLKSNTDHKIMLIDRRAREMTHTTRNCDIYADEDFAGQTAIDAIMDYRPETIIHCAADSTIASGMRNPLRTWDNNVTKMLKMLQACTESATSKIVFASSSAVYADVEGAVTEESPINPLNPYARSKLAGEHALSDVWNAHGISSVSLRFFNVAGAHPTMDLGELDGSSHLMARIMESAVNDRPLDVYGRDWPTPDGTAIRDYIHVMDVADAVQRSMSWLDSNPGAHVINLGSGMGYSVQGMIDTVEKLLNTELPYRYRDRRAGDSAKRFSDNAKASELLGWAPTRNINNIVLDSYKWYNSQIYQSLRGLGIRAE